MTLSEIVKVVSTELGVKVEDMLSTTRTGYEVAARHIYRTIASDEFKFTEQDIGRFEVQQRGEEWKPSMSRGRSAVYHSVTVIRNGQFKKEYEQCLNKIRKLFPPSPIEMDERRMEEQIIRVTQEEFDSRFYGHDTKINPRSGNKWFPSWHFLYGIGAPTDDFLVTYYKSKGFFSDVEFKRAEIMGSYVHNRIEDMGKYGIDTTLEQIYRAFPDPYESRRVQEALMGWLNFVKDEEPKVMAYEQMVIGEDWGGTVDFRAAIKSDDYKNMWTIDFKTSKSVYKSHKAQVETYRREFNDDKAGVLILGNQTKKRYTFSEVKEKERDYFYDHFKAVKEVAYLDLIQSGRLQPHPKDMPDVFTLKGLNITKL